MYRELREILHGARSVVFFGGAGVSTESGIPDFRSEQGLYQAREEYGHSPEELLSHRFFMARPDVFYRYYKENLLHPQAKPNAAHRALARLEQRGTLKAVITQNIDGLHQTAGNSRVLELHGSVLRNYCMDCGARYDLAYILSPAACGDGSVPRCSACGGAIRPDVVLYGENLDEGVLRQAVQAISTCDTLIVGGTSLVVYPAAGLIRHFMGEKLVLINREATGYDSMAHLVIHDSIGKVLGKAVGEEEL